MKKIAILVDNKSSISSELISNVIQQIKSYGTIEVYPIDIEGSGTKNFAENVELLEKFNNYDWILFENNSYSIDLACYLGSHLPMEILNNVVEISEEKVTCQTFSGKAESTYSSDQRLILILSKSFKCKELTTESMSIPMSSEIAIHFSDKKGHLIRLNKLNNAISLPDAKFVVGAGRGMKDPSNWGIIEQLSTKIGAALACSKPISDLNWRPHHEHVGQTGIKIAPKLYIACGISGAIQHLAGVNGSETIIVINSDPEAPFVKNADYAIIGDLFQVVPELLKNIK